jgi:hypothetical protein
MRKSFEGAMRKLYKEPAEPETERRYRCADQFDTDAAVRPGDFELDSFTMKLFIGALRNAG